MYVEVGRSLEFMYTVYAGLEPEGFIELFPYWVVQEDITEMQIDVSYPFLFFFFFFSFFLIYHTACPAN